MKILVTSDFHGNPQHVRAIEAAVRETQPDVFVYAGDIAPNREYYNDPDRQTDYILREFFPHIKRLPVNKKYVMPGNTDFQLSIDRYKELFNDPAECQFCTNGHVVLDEHEYNIQFLSSVSYTNHCLKDSERLDRFRQIDEQVQQSMEVSHVFSRTWQEVQLDGRRKNDFITASDRLRYSLKYFVVYKNYDDVPERYKQQLNHCIYDVLEETRPQNSYSTLLVSHSPPYGCNADMVAPGNHIGSHDIRQYIQGHPEIEAVFCGHVHQSFIVSKRFDDQIGDAAVYSTGNTGIDGPEYYKKCYFLFYDTENKKCNRLPFDCEPHSFWLERVFE